MLAPRLRQAGTRLSESPEHTAASSKCCSPIKALPRRKRPQGLHQSGLTPADPAVHCRMSRFQITSGPGG